MQLQSKPQSKRKEIIIPPELWEKIEGKYNTSRFIVDAIREKILNDDGLAYNIETGKQADELAIK